VKYPAAYNQIFNVGADVPYSVNELARQVQVAVGQDTGIVCLPARNEVLQAFSDHSKAREVFGTGAGIALAEGLRRMADWVKHVGARRGKPFDKVEVERELPPSWRELCTTPEQ
jgi:UDP-glucose 4-epimerase